MAALVSRAFALYQRGAQRQLVRGQPHCLARVLVRYAFHLEQDLSWFHDRDPVVRRALALAHSGFGGLLRHRLVGKHPNPNLAAALHKARHGYSARFNLTVGDPAGLEYLQPVIAERQRRAAPRLAGHAPALLLPILHFLWHQHRISSLLSALALSTNLRIRLQPAALRASSAAGSRPCTPSTSRRSRHTSCVLR